jgi:putative ABC transport system permease protein
VIDAVGKATQYTALERVGYADVSGFVTSEGGTTQTTGAGKVLGISPQYPGAFPAELRPLLGSQDGVLIAQQTAANLHAVPGSQVTIQRPGLPPAMLKIDGVVDLPNADSLFQAVGVPTGSAPQAPPDNVLLMPLDQWHTLFDPQAAVRPDSVHTQLHVVIAHNLPADPGSAYTYVGELARNVEARIAGSGIVGDNLAARLGGVREDALYARVLFLFLGLPGAILAVLLTLAISASGAGRRRREQGLLRIRGASTSRLLWLESVEVLIVGAGGVAAGLALALLVFTLAYKPGALFSPDALPWIVAAVLVGLALSAGAVLLPAWIEARHSTVQAARLSVGRQRDPLWQKIYLDFIVLAVSALVFWQTASTGYQIVLAPEGVAQTSVSYETFVAPICLWLGVGLLAMRLWGEMLGRARRAVALVLRGIARGLSGVVAASLSRQRGLIVRGIVLVALAFSFAVSTAVFNTTYNAQSRIDAELTNGADVTVSGPTSAPPGSKLSALRALTGVAGIQAMQHRFAYVGNDLQDIYGIDPRHISEATDISNAYFGSHNAAATLSDLASHQDGVLVSAETMKDYQLNPGDQVNLRLQNVADHQYHVATFHFLGVVREFPTAPHDSFLIANASYIAQQTGSDAAEIVLIRSTGDPSALASRVRLVVSALAGTKVSDIGSAQQTISSSLTAVDLGGLTALELAFSILLLAGATGLVLALGLAERKRTFAILAALGAKPNQMGAFLWSEGLVILVGGALTGVLLGFALAQMLVTVLTGVFDPPPEALAVPWNYLALLAVTSGVSTLVAVLGMQVLTRRKALESLRE